MGGRDQFQDIALKKDDVSSVITKQEFQWAFMETNSHGITNNGISSDSEGSTNSNNDVSSSSSSSSSPNSYGPLYELSDLMAQLPIKRSLSKYYQGKSESFGSLESLKSNEDLAKKGGLCSYNRRMKLTCKKSYGGGLINNGHKYSPKATITKKASSRVPFLSSLASKLNRAI